tara:strand:+ start:284 stop:487 length:204 start_codon:yes stop_codon:yes gene_type:complete
MNKLSHKGYNIYKNKVFQFTSDINDKREIVEFIKDYVKVNNFNLSDYTYKKFVNHNSDNFKEMRVYE